jgi:hypothetical protein
MLQGKTKAFLKSAKKLLLSLGHTYPFHMYSKWFDAGESESVLTKSSRFLLYSTFETDT